MFLSKLLSIFTSFLLNFIMEGLPICCSILRIQLVPRIQKPIRPTEKCLRSIFHTDLEQLVYRHRPFGPFPAAIFYSLRFFINWIHAKRCYDVWNRTMLSLKFLLFGLLSEIFRKNQVLLTNFTTSTLKWKTFNLPDEPRWRFCCSDVYATSETREYQFRSRLIMYGPISTDYGAM